MKIKVSTIGMLLIGLGCLHIGCAGKDVNEQKETAALIKQARNGEVARVDEHQIKEIIESFRGEKVVLVNVWATWCTPCVEEFPDLVKLDQTYRSKGLEIITVSADWPKWVDKKIKPFLEKHNAKFLGFVKDAKDDGAFINALDEKWQGEIPFTLIHAKSGERAQSLRGKQTWEAFVAAVEPLLD